MSGTYKTVITSDKSYLSRDRSQLNWPDVVAHVRQ